MQQRHPAQTVELGVIRYSLLEQTASVKELLNSIFSEEMLRVIFHYRLPPAEVISKRLQTLHICHIRLESCLFFRLMLVHFIRNVCGEQIEYSR